MDNHVEEIDADEDDEVLERVATIDVAKASGKVCVRLPGRQRRITRVFDVAATTRKWRPCGEANPAHISPTGNGRRPA